MMYRLFQKALPLLILAGGIGGLLALGRREEETEQTPDTGGVPAVSTAFVRHYEGSWSIEVDGLVQPFREITVRAEVDGRVLFKAPECKSGCFVEQGTLLIEVDPADYRLAVQRSEKQLEQARNELRENAVELANTTALLALAERDLKLSRADLERMTELSGRDVASRFELDRADRAALQSEQTLQELHNQLQTTQARRARLESGAELAASFVEKARLDLARTRIVAPVDGVIVRDSVEQDGYAQKGEALFAIEDTSQVEVDCRLRIEQLYWLWAQAARQPTASTVQQAYQIPPADATVEARFPGLPDLLFSWRGRLARYHGIGLDERTRTVPCRVVVDDPRAVTVSTVGGGPFDAQVAPPALVRGMYVGVRVHVQPNSPLVLVPDAAVQPGKLVWCVRGGRLMRLGPLTLIRRVEQSDEHGSFGDYWLAPVAEKGLSVADQVVIGPAGNLSEGARVEAVPVDRSAPPGATAN